ncbi:cytochrome o ubiquinol oxidase subunit IV [Duganella sp. BJB488]|uniref:Cytochrome bo(3) ubiquinol oxidase subunit 4 n=1 Tax=Duganella vulcania TaxID=2692166 RepID=A0A845HI71_9BURK|nr:MULTISPECIES: cytochrome o ubiquinol oxidase subunit IV [Duganella]MYM95780.1 cytochrome o ubiquinol oxidase subunit IV [Duganella vulcania]MYN19022.1 cytochrome o ubiquinol oxidase subunit IV [Duganella vulcania]RFP17628.1 cytochrome o ubiquinol oxidase subunit IV [Duganella sp. BJB489]RFP22137.1 cytochrome o ubiquinol oxidase subunit IV [Duganella sp. BJB488]RFP37472.1 cytochrome o ubiquinol oxidase subunit IV [Duganella sp. BJB480]
MSAHNHDHHGHDDHGHGHDAVPHGSLKDYAIGFVLSVILTAIPFWLVMHKAFDKSSTTAAVILAFAAVQVVVHMVYFLHMNGKIEGGWSLLATLFTLVLLVIVLAGSIWVMYHMNVNMMPSMGTDVHNMRDMQ